MRSTSDKLIHIPLTQGMNQSFNQWAAPVGTIVSCTNTRIKAAGTLEKRPGTRAVVGTTLGASAGSTNFHSLMGDGTTTYVEKPCFLSEIGESVVIGTTAGDAFCLNSTSSDNWVFQGCFSTCLPVQKRYGLVGEDATTGFGEFPASCAVNTAGYLMVAAIDGNNLLHAYIENPAGIRIWFFTGVALTALKVQAVSVGASLILVYQVGSDISALVCTPSDTSNISGVAVSVATLNGTTYHWDTTSDGSNWFMVHQSGAANMRITRFSGTTSTHTANQAVTAAICPCSIWASSAQAKVWVGYYDDPAGTGAVAYAVYGTAALAVVKAYTVITTAVNVYGPPLFGGHHDADMVTSAATAATAFFGYKSGDFRGMVMTTVWNDGTATNPGVTLYGVLPISKPDNYHRIWTITDNGNSNQTQQQVLLLRCHDVTGTGTVLAPTVELSSPTMEAIGSTYDPSVSSMYWGPQSAGATRNAFAFPFVLASVGGIPIIGITVYEFTTGEIESHKPSLKMGPRTVVSGSPVELYGQSIGMQADAASDGQPAVTGASEIGFAQRPVLLSVTDFGSGPGPGPASGQTSAVFSYRVVYEWLDMYGRIHRSAPSKDASITLTFAQTVTLQITSLSASQRMSDYPRLPVSARIYRTVANGTTYHRLPGFTACSMGGTPLSFSDTFTDANISPNALIYTDGGVLQNDLAPSCRFICKAEDRVWFGGLWDPNVVQCSKEIVPGEPIQCTDHESHKVPLLANCTGLAYMDGSVIAFCASAIYVITGEGPNAQGVGAFPSPRILASEIGCDDYKSILETSIGVLFKSKLGIYLIPRGLGAPQYIGAAARLRMLSTPQVISAASCMSNGNHMARWVLGAANAQTGSSALSLDLNSNQWFQDTFASPMSEIGSSSAEGGFVLAKTSLNSASVTYPVWIESSLYTDDESGAVYTGMALATSKIFPFGPGGWGKINKCMVAFEQTSVTCTARVYASVDGYSQQFADFSIASGSGIAYRGIDITNRYGTSITVQILDLAVGALLKPVSITLEIEPSSGVHQLTAAERA